MNIDYLLALYSHSSSVVSNEIEQLLNMQKLDFIILGLITFYVCKKISSYAHSFIPRLVFVLIAVYGIWQQLHSHYIIFGLGLYSGAGFIQPHIQYMTFGVFRLIENVKALTYNTFTLVLTVWYKFVRIFMWFCDTYKKIDTFFQKRKYDKTKAKFEKNQEKQRQKEQKQYEKEQKKQKKQNSYYEKQEYKNSYQQEEKTSNRNNQYSNNDYNSNNQSNYNEQSSYTNNSYEEPSYSSNDEFAQFYSSDDYIVLGVSRSDDYSTIKKSYRDLAMMYHPDKNYEEWDKYNDIFQRINEAHDNLKKRHK